MDLKKGDCLEVLKTLPDKSIDFVYLDVPFGQTACKWDQKLDLSALWKELKRLARSDRTPFFFSCTTKFGYEIIKSNEKYFRWDLVWEKNKAAGFLNAYKLPMRKHEMIYCFAKKSPEYDVSSHKEFKQDKHISQYVNDDQIYGKVNPPFSKRHKDPLPTSVLPEQPSSWCKFKLDSNTGHRTAKPVALMEFLLKYWTQEGWTVLDPTMGSGSMGIAAKRMKRKFIGIEKDDDIFELAKQRIKSSSV